MTVQPTNLLRKLFYGIGKVCCQIGAVEAEEFELWVCVGES